MDTNSSRSRKRTRIDDNDEVPLVQVFKRPRIEESPVKLQNESYTIAWICALHIEMAVANAMLDEIHSNLPSNPNDSNSYTLGNIGGHNIVVACLPANHYGTNSAAVVANNLVRTFPSIRTGFMVGIGGGVPGSVDLRLGDIVVGYNVIQHDLGKVIQGSGVHRTGTPKSPPFSLLTAVSKLKAIHESRPSRVPSFLQKMIIKDPKMIKYTYPSSSQDRLFLATYPHSPERANCDSCDTFMLVHRRPRMHNHPVIHYGNIASGNQVMKDAISRDEIAQELNVICFEMEAAGLVDTFPCLVVRGICDYSDSHKNEQWQGGCDRATLEAKWLLYSRTGSSSRPMAGIKFTVHHIPDTATLARLVPETDLEAESIDTKEPFVDLLRHRFKDLGTNKIERGEWTLEYQHNGQRLDLSKDWQSIIKPNQVLIMRMIFRRQNNSSAKCPSCGFKNPGLQSDQVQCRRCSLNFRRIEEIQGIRISSDSSNAQTDRVEASTARFRKPRRPPTPLNPEDDISRYKQVQLVDVDFKIGSPTVDQQHAVMETALKLSSGDLSDTELLAERLAFVYGLCEADSHALSQKIDIQQAHIRSLQRQLLHSHAAPNINPKKNQMTEEGFDTTDRHEGNSYTGADTTGADTTGADTTGNNWRSPIPIFTEGEECEIPWPSLEDDGSAISPRVGPSKHESDTESTRSTPPPRALARTIAVMNGRRTAPLKNQIFEGSSPTRHGNESDVVARKPRPRESLSTHGHLVGEDLEEDDEVSSPAEYSQSDNQEADTSLDMAVPETPIWRYPPRRGMLRVTPKLEFLSDSPPPEVPSAQIRPVTGDAVLVAYLGGGSHPEVARYAKHQVSPGSGEGSFGFSHGEDDAS